MANIKTTAAPAATDTQPAHPGTARSYTTGFLLSILLTVMPFILVMTGRLSGSLLVIILLGYAVLQVLIQLVFFLHLPERTRPYLSTKIFLFMALIVSIVVIGSLWIMYNLEYRMMNTEAVERELLEDEARSNNSNGSAEGRR